MRGSLSGLCLGAFLSSLLAEAIWVCSYKMPSVAIIMPLQDTTDREVRECNTNCMYYASLIDGLGNVTMPATVPVFHSQVKYLWQIATLFFTLSKC